MLAKTDDERIWMLNPRLLVKGDIIVKARLMSKYDSLLGRPLSDWIITDSNGNDPLFLPIEYPTPESLDTAKSDFIKVYHLFFETLSGLGGKESEVLNFLVCAMRNSDNTYTGPMKKIAENVNCSKCGILEGAECLQRMLFAKNLPLCPALRREVDSGNPPNSSRSRKKGEGAGFPTP